MPSASPSSPPRSENAHAVLVHFRVAIVRMRAHCRTAAATIAELRESKASTQPRLSAPRGVLLYRVNHDMAVLARTSAQVDALRSLASPAMRRDIETNGRSRDSLEQALDDVADLAGDLRVVLRSESIAVVGPHGGSVSVVALAAALESKTAVFRIADLHPAGPERASPSPKRSATGRRFALLDIATAFLSRRLVARGA